MNRPNQVVPSFSSVYLTADQTLAAAWTVVLFDIVETDGSTSSIYDPASGEFTCPVSGWYDLDIQLQSSALLTGVRIIRNGDINFPVSAIAPASIDVHLRSRMKLGLGETLRVEGFGAVDVLALAGTTPDARVSNTIFTLVKRFDDAKIF